jgi:cysteine-rich repeat protein
VNVGEAEFNRLFRASPNKIIKRWCADCSPTHQQIFYKRLTDLDTFEPYAYMLQSWVEANNVMGTDFKLYSTYHDALADTNAWQFCSFAGDFGFPYECGPEASSEDQHATFLGEDPSTSGKYRVTFFVEQSPPTLSVDVTHRYGANTDVPVLYRQTLSPTDAPPDGCIGCIGDSDSVGFKGASFTTTAWLSPVTWRPDADGDGFSDDSWLSLFSTPEDAQHNRLFIGLNGANQPIMGFTTNRLPCAPPADTPGLSGSTWAHVAWRYDIGEQLITIFVDGNVVAICDGRLAFRGQGQVSLGTGQWGPYIGHLRDIKIYEEPATVYQIREIANLLRIAWEWQEGTTCADPPCDGRYPDGGMYEGCWKRSSKCLGSPLPPVRMRGQTTRSELSDSYTYSQEKTPSIAGINRRTGTTAGGTTVNIYGENFGEEAEIELSGVNCATTRDDVGEYRGRNLCDWGDIQRSQGKADMAVNCNNLGFAPVCVATAHAECSEINTNPSLSDSSNDNLDSGRRACESNPKCRYEWDEERGASQCVAAATNGWCSDGVSETETTCLMARTWSGGGAGCSDEVSETQAICVQPRTWSPGCAAAGTQSACEAVPGHTEQCIDTYATCEGYVQCETISNGRTRSGRTCDAEITASTCPNDCTLRGISGLNETCTNTIADCSTGYIPGDASNPCPTDSCSGTAESVDASCAEDFVVGQPSTCPKGCDYVAGCTFTPRQERGCTWYEESVTCLSQPFWNSGAPPTVGAVDLVAPEAGLASVPDNVDWTYANLWSKKTTWGGNEPPMTGDSVVVTKGEHIVLDISPPLLELVILQGTLAFDDSQDLMFNASYIFIHGGKLQVGTESEPFLHEAYITIHGTRASYEIPVYGAKCLGVRNGILDLHGRPDVKWTRLASTAFVNQTFIDLREPVQWRPNDLIVIASTSFDQEEAEPMRVARLTNNGYRVILTKPLKHEHLGDGWSESGYDSHLESCTAVNPADSDACAAADLSNDSPELSEAQCWSVGEGRCIYHSGRGWAEDGEHIPEYSAEVGLLTSNVRVSGNMPVSKIEQFGTQVVLHARGDNSAVGRLSFIEVYNSGQGLKLGKYPVHFHMIGDVSASYVRGISIHHVFNRAIAIHGVQNLRVQNNFIFDARGHAVFLEDGTETGHLIEHTAVIVTRPVWSLLLVDQSPAAFWIVNPDNTVRDCAATSSHYGFWYRALQHPDGVSGQENKDDGLIQCPQKTPLGVMEGNVAHSVGKYGMKMSQYFPAVGGANCLSPTISTPATFQSFTVYKAQFFGIWGENWVDLHFDDLRFADYAMGGIEPMSTNGLLAQFARTNLTNSLFVGTTVTVSPDDPREMGRADGAGHRVRAGKGKDACNAKTGQCGRQMSKFMNQADVAEAVDGLRDASQLDNDFVHAIHLPGTGSELLISGTTIMRHRAAIVGAAWVSIGRGGYETEFERMTLKDVGQIVSWTHKYSWILRDRDGSMAGRPGWIAPVSGIFDRNPDCHLIEASEGRYQRGGSLRGAYICDKPVRRVGLQVGAPPFDLFHSHYSMGGGDFSNVPKLTVTDITDITPESPEANEQDVFRMVGGIVTCPPWGHKHPMALPYGTVPRGQLSCLEQAPKNQYSFVVATGRKYLIAFYDRYDVFVAGGMNVAMFKMKPEEHIIFTMSHKAPFNRDRYTRAYTVRKTVEAWPIQGQEKLWDDMPASLLPVYATGKLTGTCAAVAETTPNLAPVGQRFKGIAEADCLISRSCRPPADNSTVWTRDNCVIGKELVGPRDDDSFGNLATQSSTAHGYRAVNAVDGRFDNTIGEGSCTLTQDNDPFWQVDLACTRYGCGGEKENPDTAAVWPDPDGKMEEVVGFVSVQARGETSALNSLDKAAIYVSDGPSFFAGTLCGRISNPGLGEKIMVQCERPIVGRYVTIYTSYTTELTLCEVQVFSCLMPNSGQLPGTSCTSIGFAPELATRPEFEDLPADAYPFTGQYMDHGPNRRIGNVDLKIDQFESEHNAGSESIIERVAVTDRNLAFGRAVTDGDGYDRVNLAMQTSTPTGASLIDGNISTCQESLVAGTAGGLPWDPHYRIELTTETMIHTVWVKTNDKPYEGDLAVTSGGYECQSWDAQLPNAHPFGDRSVFPELGGHNYCRNPDNRPTGPWCYTTDGTEWDSCGIGGTLQVKLANEGVDWNNAYECTAHPTGFLGPHASQVDPVSGLTAFYCNGCPHYHLSPNERPGPPGARAAGNCGDTPGTITHGCVTSPGDQPGGQHLRACNHTKHDLEGPFMHILVGVAGVHELNLCEVIALDSDHVPDWEPIHGSYYFDPWDDRGGDADPWYYTPREGPKPDPQAYNPAFTAAMSVVLAGNTSVEIRAERCPRAGCPSRPPMPTQGSDERTFLWSDPTGWDRTGNPDEDIPSDYGDTEIPEKWTVILDVETPVLRVLTIRGRLIYQTDAPEPIGVHAHFVDIRGGELTIGNATDPFLGNSAHLTLHGDVYVWQGVRDGLCNSEKNPLDTSYPECGKKVNVRGKMTVFGRPRKEIVRFGADAYPGDYTLTMATPTDWLPGERILLTGVGSKHGINIWTASFPDNGRQIHTQKEVREIATVSADGLTIGLTEPLEFFHSGTMVDEPDERTRVGHLTDDTPGRIVVDTRDSAALLDGRNVEISAGEDPSYDMVSGVPMRDQMYGFTIHVMGRDTEPLPGWTEDMDNYEKEGKKHLPVGNVNIQNCKFNDAGKQYLYKCGLNVCAMQYPAVTGANVLAAEQGGQYGHGNGNNGDSRSQGSGVPGNEQAIFRHALTTVVLKGIVSMTPRTGLFVGGVPGMDLQDNILLGHELTVANADARIVNNLFLANFDNIRSDADGACSLTCSESWPVTLAGGGSLVFKDNRVMEAYVGWANYKSCDQIEEWSNNVAIGNWMGAHLLQGCGSLPLEAYRNSVGVGAAQAVPEVSNVELVENGVGLSNHEFILPPEEIPSLSWRWFRGRTNWVDSTIIGRSQKTKTKRELNLQANCGERWNGHPHSNGGLKSGFREFGQQWDYVGIQLTSSGNAGTPTSNAWAEVDGVHFIGFPGPQGDECGHVSTAITNDPAGIGKGRFDKYWDIFTVGRVQTQRVDGNYGHMTCQPTFVRRLMWTEVPLEGKFQFSMGAIAGQVPGSFETVVTSSSVSMHPEHVPAYSSEVFTDSCSTGRCATGNCERARNGRIESTCAGRDGWPKADAWHDDSTDYGFSECMLYDEDESLKPRPENWGVTHPQSTPASYSGDLTDSPQMFISAAPRQWPSLYNGHCQYTLENTEWWDTKDELNAINRCPPFLRREPSLLLAAMVPARQGVSFQKPDDGTWVADWGKIGATPAACTPLPGNGAMDCNTESANDYIWLRNDVPLKVVSGSQVLYGPVTVSTCSYDGGEPLVNFVPTEYFWHSMPAGLGPWGGCQMDLQHGRSCVVSPMVHHLSNGGCYRLDYTGDIGLFKTNTFSLINADMTLRTGRKHKPRAPRNQENSWAVVIEAWFTFPGKINVFFNEAYVPPVGRRDRVTANSPAGTNYFNPGSRTLSFVVKGTKASDKTKLRLIEVVEVNLIVAETFESFFADNNVDPATISPSFAAQLPPNYSADYDPDRGGIVKQNRFVRNMASVLRINPERIRVTNIVPGNRRRMQEATCTVHDPAVSCAAPVDDATTCPEPETCVFTTGSGSQGTCAPATQADCDAALANDDGSGEACAAAKCVYGAPSMSADGLDIGFDISAVDPCQLLQCGEHGTCEEGECVCDTNWMGAGVEESCSPSTGAPADCTLTRADPSAESCIASTGTAADCTLTPADASAEGCTSSTGVTSDCTLIPADPTASPATEGSCTAAGNDAVCTYVPPVAGSCATVANDATCTYVPPRVGSCATAANGAVCEYNPQVIGCSTNPCEHVDCGDHGSCNSAVGGWCVCTDAYTGENCEIEPLPDDPCIEVTCPTPSTCHAAGTCTPRSCTAKAQSTQCDQPAPGETVCPNDNDCVFTETSGTCSIITDPVTDTREACEALPNAVWAPQGTCTLSDQITCTNALRVSTGGSLDETACEALKCAYVAGGTCGVETPLADGIVCDDGDAETDNDVCTSGACAGTPVPDREDNVEVEQPGTAGTFAELAAVGEALITSASSGTLDLGYEVTGMDVVLPDDECGVPGGDGTTCLDECGVANGDNSSCADVCGVPNGDGFSCRDQCDTCLALNPNEQGHVALCGASDVSFCEDGVSRTQALCTGQWSSGSCDDPSAVTYAACKALSPPGTWTSSASDRQRQCLNLEINGVSVCRYTGGVPDGDGSTCAPPVVFDLESCTQTERQRIRLQGHPGMSGQISLSFNGYRTTSPISIPYSTAEDVKMALETVESVGTVNVVGLLSQEKIAEATSSATRLDMVVEFTSLGSPLNGGRLPLIKFESYPADTIASSIAIERVCAGQFPSGTCAAGYSQGVAGSCPPGCTLSGTGLDETCTQNYEEQLIVLPGAQGGSFRLGLDGEYSDPIYWNATASDIHYALEGLAVLPDPDLFEVLGIHGRDDLVPDLVAADATAWTVRFYPVELSPLLLISEIDTTTITPRACTARDGQAITCAAPAPGATVCSDDPSTATVDEAAYCVFAACESEDCGGSCSESPATTKQACHSLSPPGVWISGNQGTCAVSDQATCTAALAVTPTNGTACAAAKCLYTPRTEGTCTAKEDPVTSSCPQPFEGDTSCPTGVCSDNTINTEAACTAPETWTPSDTAANDCYFKPGGSCSDATPEVCEVVDCASGYVQGAVGTCPAGCTLNGQGETETCTPTVADCDGLADDSTAGTCSVTAQTTKAACQAVPATWTPTYVPGDATTASTTCPSGCVFARATAGTTEKMACEASYGTWTPSPQGICAVADQEQCTDALVNGYGLLTGGSACTALKCSFAPIDKVSGDLPLMALAADALLLSPGECSESSVSTETDCLALDPAGTWTPNIAVASVTEVQAGSVPTSWMPTTCTDQRMNGDELNIDCGGSCAACPPPPPPPPPPCENGCCTAKSSAIPCAQPASGETQCPNDDTNFCSDPSAQTEEECEALTPPGTWTPSEHCVFTPGGDCSDGTSTTQEECTAASGAWTPSEQGKCALTDWDTCQLALDADADGTLCRSLKCQYTPPPPPAITIAEVVRVCGDGSRTSNERCDDGNLESGDGCDGLCKIEDGFVCPSNALGAESVCVKPQEALVALAAQSHAITVAEGSSVTLNITRAGKKRGCSAQPGWFPEGSCTARTLEGDERCAQPDFEANGGSCIGSSGQLPEVTTEAECRALSPVNEWTVIDTCPDSENCRYREPTGGICQPQETCREDADCASTAASKTSELTCNRINPLTDEPFGAWVPYTQGTCALATAEECSAALRMATGDAAQAELECNAIKCTYTAKVQCEAPTPGATACGTCDSDLMQLNSYGNNVLQWVQAGGHEAGCVSVGGTWNPPVDGCLFTAPIAAGSCTVQGNLQAAVTSEDGCAALEGGQWTYLPGVCEQTADDVCHADGLAGSDEQACNELGCVYDSGSLFPGDVFYTTVPGTAIADATGRPSGKSDFVFASGSVSFERDQTSATFEVDTNLDDIFGEADKVFNVVLSLAADDGTQMLAEEDLVTSVITITNAEDCAGWPPILPDNSLEPCTAVERISPLTGTLCADRGSCPAATDTAGEHLASCEIVCAPGYRVSGAQPSCSTATGTLTNELSCEEIPGTLKATIPVAIDIITLAERRARLEFEETFSNGVALLLGIDSTRVKVVSIIAADGRRRMQSGATSAGIIVEFIILPATVAGAMATEPDTAVSTALFQVLSGPISIAQGISSPSGVVLSGEDLEAALAAIGRNPLTVTAAITLACTIDQAETATFKDAFKTGVAALLTNHTNARPVTADHIAIAATTSSAGSVVVNFLVLPYDAGSDVQVALHIGALEEALADGVLVAGYAASGLTHAGGIDEAIILPPKPGEPEEPNMVVGIMVGVGAAGLICLMLMLATLSVNARRASAKVGTGDKTGKRIKGAVIGASSTPTAAEFETDSEGDEETAVRGIVGLPSQGQPGNRLPPIAGSPTPTADPFGDPVPIMMRRTDASARAAEAAQARGMLGP